MENDFKVIGLTGQSGAGKSTVSQIFKELGGIVVNADALAHTALRADVCKENLREAFGDSIFDCKGEVIRKKLARIAFSSKENTQKLNAATHPVIASLAKAEFDRYRTQGEELIIFDAPTLFESGLDSECSVVVSVIADKDIRAQRIIERDSITYDEAILRLNAQHDDSFYTSRSAFVITNNGTAEELKKKAKAVFGELCI